MSGQQRIESRIAEFIKAYNAGDVEGVLAYITAPISSSYVMARRLKRNLT